MSIAPSILPVRADGIDASRRSHDEYKPAHVPALDGIRGIAVIMVISHHLFAGDVTHIRLVDGIYRVLGAGWMGVDLFFVLSGFLITGILVDTRRKEHFFRNFYARRSLRIFPLYFGFLTFSLAMGWLSSDQDWLWTYMANIKIALAGGWVSFSRTDTKAFGYFWSLAVEEHFYLVWPLIVYFCPVRWLLSVALSLASLSFIARTIFVFVTRHTLAAYVLTPFRVDSLLCGAICAVLVRSAALRDRVFKVTPLCFVITTLMVTGIYCLHSWDRDSRLDATFGFSLLALWFGSLILWVLAVGPVHPIRILMESQPLRFLGKYSYGIYMYHPFIFGFVLAGATPWFSRHLSSNVLSDLAAKSIACTSAMAVAWASWHCYENPILRLKRFF